MLPDMLKLSLQDLPDALQNELLAWIKENLIAVSTYPAFSTTYNLKQHFKFSDPINYHITNKIFHEAMCKSGFKGRLLKDDSYQYKAKLK